jgi:hypothetical protein
VSAPGASRLSAAVRQPHPEGLLCFAAGTAHPPSAPTPLSPHSELPSTHVPERQVASAAQSASFLHEVLHAVSPHAKGEQGVGVGTQAPSPLQRLAVSDPSEHEDAVSPQAVVESG